MASRDTVPYRHPRLPYAGLNMVISQPRSSHPLSERVAADPVGA